MRWYEIAYLIFMAALFITAAGLRETKGCVCGHMRKDHLHHSANEHCWRCGSRHCSRFMRDWWWFKVFRKFGIAKSGGYVYPEGDTATHSHTTKDT